MRVKLPNFENKKDLFSYLKAKGGDHTYEDYCLEGNGIVTNLSCPSNECDVNIVIVYTLLEDA